MNDRQIDERQIRSEAEREGAAMYRLPKGFQTALLAYAYASKTDRPVAWILETLVEDLIAHVVAAKRKGIEDICAPFERLDATGPQPDEVSPLRYVWQSAVNWTLWQLALRYGVGVYFEGEGDTAEQRTQNAIGNIIREVKFDGSNEAVRAIAKEIGTLCTHCAALKKELAATRAARDKSQQRQVELATELDKALRANGEIALELTKAQQQTIDALRVDCDLIGVVKEVCDYLDAGAFNAIGSDSQLHRRLRHAVTPADRKSTAAGAAASSPAPSPESPAPAAPAAHEGAHE